MWNWDQGRLDYFQFDALRKIAKFALTNDLKNANHASLSNAVGLPFSPNDPDYLPWRNYGRALKLSMLVADQNKVAQPTSLAKLIAVDGSVTSDEYFHFLAEGTSDPSPALQGWDVSAKLRYPLLFALKYALASAAIGQQTIALKEIVDAYAASIFNGDEDQTAFIGLVRKSWPKLPTQRQAIESIRVLSQISYLSSSRTHLSVALEADDARDIFVQLAPIGGTAMANGNEEIQRIAGLYPSAAADLELDFSHTVVSNAVEAGFAEGNRVERTHLKIERNSKVRKAFFEAYPSAKCDFCESDTQADYPWTERVLDIHHLLPLCSGTRATKSGTALDDLVANCPTCHRAVHRYYSRWLKKHGQKDFADAAEAKAVYDKAKKEFAGT